MEQESESNVATANKSGEDQELTVYDLCPVVVPRGQFAKKLVNAAPYNIFYTTITDSPLTHSEPLSITFQELLDRSLGELQASLQINFVVNIDWLLSQYKFAGYEHNPLLVLYGQDTYDEDTINSKLPNVSTYKIRILNAIGSHHSKIMLFSYKDGSMRVVISTANLTKDEWDNCVQGMWVSPTCPPLSDSEGIDSDEGNGPTNFKEDLIDYLNNYRLSGIREWIERVRRTDFSHINVFLVTSTPGTHKGNDLNKYGHKRMASLLSKYCTIPANNTEWTPSDWSILCQSSSIGSFGPSPYWLYGQLCSSFSKIKQKISNNTPTISLIYPSLENVKQSYDQLFGGWCLNYERNIHENQLWLQNHLYQWKALSKHRDRTVPHIKTYCRISPDSTLMAWFLLTSHNTSKSAWGNCFTSSQQIRINSYEVGVLFIPEFVTKKESFFLNTGNIETNEDETKNYFPFPYDLPLTKYEENDEVFLTEFFTEYIENCSNSS